MPFKAYLSFFILLTASLACSLPLSQNTTPANLTPALPKQTETNLLLETATNPATETPQPSITPAPSETASPSPAPTYITLRGKTISEKTSCRYGPGADYLYLYGLNQGAVQDVIGRNEAATWVLTQARGDVIRCWIKTSLLELNGDVMAVEPVDPHIVLAWSPYYGPLTGVSAVRAGSEVTVSWHALPLRAGDDSLQTPYIVEAWVCRNGQLVFEPFGTYALAIKITDEKGCAEPSHGRVIAAEKHGYTVPVEIPWP